MITVQTVQEQVEGGYLRLVSLTLTGGSTCIQSMVFWKLSHLSSCLQGFGSQLTFCSKPRAPHSFEISVLPITTLRPTVSKFSILVHRLNSHLTTPGAPKDRVL